MTIPFFFRFFLRKRNEFEYQRKYFKIMFSVFLILSIAIKNAASAETGDHLKNRL